MPAQSLARRCALSWPVLVAVYRLTLCAAFVAVPSALFGGGYASAHIPNALLPVGRVVVGEHRLIVEVADTPGSRARGEMFRDSVYLDGMLFRYPAPRRVAFWMRNTFMSLDIVYIGCDWRVRRVVRDARPLDDSPRPSGSPVCAVLELSAGSARRYGIDESSIINYQKGLR